MTTTFEFNRIEIPTDGNLIIDSVELPKSNYNSLITPTTSNDNTEGYSKGSIWIDTNNNDGYICVDDSTGVAIWEGITFIPANVLEQGTLFGTEATSAVTVGSDNNDTTIYGQSITILTDASAGTINIGTDASTGGIYIGNTVRTVNIGYDSFALNTTDIVVTSSTFNINKEYIYITTDASGGTLNIGTDASIGTISVGNSSREVQFASSQCSMDATNTINIGTDVGGTGILTIGNIGRVVNIDAPLQIKGDYVGRWDPWDLSENSVSFNIDMSGGTNQYSRVNEIIYLMFDFYVTNISSPLTSISLYSLPVSPTGSGITSSIISIQNITTPGYATGMFEITGGNTTLSIKYSFLAGEVYRITGQIYYNV